MTKKKGGGFTGGSGSTIDYGRCVSQHHIHVHHISLITSLGLLFFSSYWGVEAIIRGGYSTRGTFISRYCRIAPNFCGAEFCVFGGLVWNHESVLYRIPRLLQTHTHYSNFADNSIIIELLKVNCRDT